MNAVDRDVAFLMGLPFDVMRMDDAVADAVAHIEARKPGYYITANVDFVAQAYENEALKDILFHADRVVCDGMPLVWLSRYFKPELPERIAGSDLVFRLFDEAKKHGWKLYFLGSDERTLARTSEILQKDYPGIQIVGTFAPPYGSVDSWPNDEILKDLKQAQPDLTLVAVGCPKQEYWISQYYKESGVPLSIGIGASLDFICGKQTRAPKFIQKIGMEWMWRLMTDPRRLLKRYVKDFYYLMLLANRQRKLMHVGRSDVVDPGSGFDEKPMPEGGAQEPADTGGSTSYQFLSWKGAVEFRTMNEQPMPENYDSAVLLDLSMVTFIDSTGVGLLAKLAREARRADSTFALIKPSGAVERVIKTMNLETQLPSFPDRRSAVDSLEKL
ncbi:MAG: exopolysaccharide biosynthesis WecB/TagA/CpsF family protein/anti-anti-sigma factor [Lentimonas sp.]|jgi:N-acetylglucosaminyldiphosphoundecaprenol N-acetyl-beta-D-mannosaminyltransferase